MDTHSKREQIIDALGELINEQDIKNISVSDIAQKANIGKGSIYYYFESKDAIKDIMMDVIKRADQVNLANGRTPFSYPDVREDGTFDIKVSKEYDLINDDYNGELYTENDKYRKCEYTPVEQCSPPIPKSIVEECSFQKPQDILMYIDINFDNK